MKKIYTNFAPEPVGPYSQAIKAGNYLYCSGQIAINPADNTYTPSIIENETLQVINNINAVLKEAGYSFADVVKTTCFLDDMNDFSKFNEIYSKYFISSPARSCVQAKLPKSAKVEIEVVAYKE